MSKPTAVPKQDSKETGSGTPKVEFKGYVNITMTSTESKKAKQFLAENVGIVAKWMQEVVESGYSIKVSWSEYNKGISAGLYCQKPDMPNTGYCLTQHSNDAELALTKVLYVHFQLLGKSWDRNGNPVDLDEGW